MSKWKEATGQDGLEYVLQGMPENYIVRVHDIAEDMWFWELKCDKSQLYSGEFYVDSPDFASDVDFLTAQKAMKNAEKEIPKKLKHFENTIKKINKALK